jgi:hypothetical protein
MSKSNLPGFSAEASLYETTGSYRSRVTQLEASKPLIVVQGVAAPSAGLVVPAGNTTVVFVRCVRGHDGVWECDELVREVPK